jgi:acetyl-CoA C-acetyltransferase
MAERVGIVAIAQTKYHPNRADAFEGELAYEVIRPILEETSLGFSDKGNGIDCAITCSQDFWDG